MPEATPAAAAARGNPGREYETIYVLRPDVAKEAAEKVATRVEEAVTREGGKLTEVATWGRRSLAYVVTKYKRGVYVYVKYAGSGAAVNELERNLRMLDEVLKYQTVKVRDGVDMGGLAVDPEAVKFDQIEPPAETEVEESLERALGLVDPPEGERRHRPPADDVDEFGDEGPDGMEDDE